jgi:hypothetical protein
MRWGVENRLGARQICLLAALILLFAVAARRSNAQSTPCQAGSGVCVLTWEQDTGVNICPGCAYRTGQNLQESVITPISILSDGFGQLCSIQVDGQVYAEPLIVSNVTFPNLGTFNVAYVVTQNNTLYAINATPTAGNSACSIIASQSMESFILPAGQTPVLCSEIGGKKCFGINPTVGILSTPVIQTNGSGGTIYLVTYTQDATGNFYHYLHALDITTLLEQPNSPVLICPPGQTCPSANSFSYYHTQRAGLLLANCGSADPPCNGNNYIYVAFSMADGAPAPDFPNGALFGYDASNLSDPNVFYLQTSSGVGSQTSNGAGIWMAGAAPAYGPDASGESWIYAKTGNGSFDLDQGGTDAGDSFLKINPNGLQIQTDGSGNTIGYLTPVDQYFRSAWQAENGTVGPVCPPQGGDQDFGSGGVTLIPDNALPNWPQLTVSGEKEGGIWFIDRNIPGQYQNACSSNPCACTPSGNNPSGNIQTYWTGAPYSGRVLWGGLAYWQTGLKLTAGGPAPSFIFGGSYDGHLARYPLCASTNSALPMCQGTKILAASPTFTTGATPTISASSAGAADAIVWAIGGQLQNQTHLPVTPGVLYAFDALTMQELYSSSTCSGRDGMAASTKFSVPTVANGYVYVGAESLQSGVNNGVGTFYIFGPNSGTCFQKNKGKHILVAKSQRK